ncbi:fumarylacetoacetate hydrolase family protein [Microbacterium sp. SORGH_AS_0862]|uniref:fumarylacetoacetate hydrolase family protein n=1 Tax=Microbacterium sp. SORGH_AS_0862 TaxID=3041789 RepID=UPI0027941C93|nr:fumarylacetoacetate hydrolase family protein [Microbacterium sp. SORGH_AS_0862]MDQ1204827.1 2-keto-4-pentenoate hydratase/2-oxohepta-3-ene-1,7-dioic acid hydratase in catechol pathway [Microbacterium sp. SORGH_AS_0862]
MRIARWTRQDGTTAEGFVDGDRVLAFPDGSTVAQVLRQGLERAHALYDRTRAEVPGQAERLDAVKLLPPLVPSSIRDFVAFEEHVEGVSAGVEGKSDVAPEWYEAPTFYFTNPHIVHATGDVVPVPESRRLDFELEVAAVVGGVVGSDGVNLDVVAAAAHIFGYTVMNDWSARDLQAREMKVRLGPAKGKDFGTTLGPWIVTADELTDVIDAEGFLAVRAEVYVNGDLVGEDLVSNMGWTFPELVAYAARNSIVVPGDVLGSGTVGNGGCLGELWGRGSGISPLEPGDEVRMVVERVGEIVNVVGERIAAPVIARARPRPRLRRR